jgi:UV DNA damage endonuclease|tara:strand:- start:308 stop:1159 length:852 start_codon:yes stop_codon:yes gene_type:complete
MIKKTFQAKGLEYAGELGLKNAKDLLHILKWNKENGINFFRLSSDFFPWASNYKFEELPQFNSIKAELEKSGKFAIDNGIRITSHPGPFNVLVSPREHVVENTITDLEIHGRVFDLMGLSQTPYNKLNIHCNGVYGDKISAMDRFCKNFKRLSPSVQSRLTVENDDKASMYSVKDLMYIHERIGIPIVFDYHHHKFNTGGLSEEEALKLAMSTWPDGIKPAVHYSESKALHEENDKIKPQAHSDYINELPNLYGMDVAVMVEAKAKELAILPFINKVSKLIKG